MPTKPKPKPERKYKWAVEVLCLDREHARRARANIDNGLRKLRIKKLES